MPTQREQIQELSRTIGSAHGMWGAGDLRDAVHDAVRLPGPAGVPGAIDRLGRDFAAMSGQVDSVRAEVADVARSRLPDVWTGQVGEKAAEAVTAAAQDLDRMTEDFTRAGRVLVELCDALAQAQATHARSAGSLARATVLLADITTVGGLPDPVHWDDDKMHEAKAEAVYAIGLMLDAAVRAEEAGHRAAAELNRLAAQTGAARLAGGGLSATDRLVLAGAGGFADLNRILSATDATRAGQFLDRLAPADRQRLNALLAGAKSAEERAYLLKALAAGHSVDEVAAFDAQIHEHGGNRAWLDARLSPTRHDPQPRTGIDHLEVPGFLGAAWVQDGSTCVAASTVTARAVVDPVYAFQLTTGGRPGDPGSESAAAFTERLRAEQHRVYDGSREWYQDLPLIGQEGLSDDQSRDVANRELGTRTGTDYRNVPLDGPDGRRDVLVDVEKAVDEGKPVPVSIRGGDQGHQLMIIGHDGDKLQVYNPWGYTTWITEDDFVNNHMDHALDQPPRMDTATSVRLPK
ncbi:peptidoglycan-binding protein [Kitasatospora cineracea]|uniref:peptidoglycan-binding protein n=1 Tax=Kitasatospora cineracea TaxID=88074 RepID=UPI0033F00545